MIASSAMKLNLFQLADQYFKEASKYVKEESQKKYLLSMADQSMAFFDKCEEKRGNKPPQKLLELVESINNNGWDLNIDQLKSSPEFVSIIDPPSGIVFSSDIPSKELSEQKKKYFQSIPFNSKFGLFIANTSETTKDGMGFGLFTSENIQKGEIVMEDHSFLSASLFAKEQVCSCCSKPLERSACTCPKCNQEYYCSESCKDKAYQSFHKVMCNSETINAYERLKSYLKYGKILFPITEISI